RWWGSVGKIIGEVDVIGAYGEGGRRIGLLGACKFKGKEADRTEIEKLFAYADHVKGLDVKNYAVFSRSGFTDSLELRAEIDKVGLITLDDMYDPSFIEKMRSEHTGSE
ncbi:MAG: hypothetical protein FWG19_03495, partial [Methanomassiliicoccaceae archaeon]|nr:hypothetical protein [Methanomassiliicoccaceae archaeon]